MFWLLFLHFLLLSAIILSRSILYVFSSNLPAASGKRICRPVPEDVLQRRLGEAFDSRYMSMADPRRPDSSQLVPQLANLDLTDDFGVNGRRHRRRNWKEPWSCDTIPETIDLGPDHYPRYLNSKKCTSDRCFYGAYYCRPRTYSVNVLRRLPDTCVEAPADSLDLVPYDILDKDEPVVLEAWEFTRYNVIVYCECKVFPDGPS